MPGDGCGRISGVENLVVILGAGASVESGIPTFASFREAAYDAVAAMAEGDTVQHLAMDVWRELYPGLNLEEVITAMRLHEDVKARVSTAALMARARKLELVESDGELPLGALANELEEVIPATLTRAADLRSRKQYEILCAQIGGLVDGGTEVRVISLNWDTLFELTAEGHFHTPHPGVGRGPEQKAAGVTILKPHGSLSYEACLNRDCTDAGLMALGSNREDWYERSAHELSPCRACSLDEFRSLVFLPPQAGKQLPAKLDVGLSNRPGGIRPWFEQTWTDLYSALKGADAIISIGYSWSPLDYALRIQTSQALNLGGDTTMMVVTGPAVETRQNERARMAVQQSVWTLFPASPQLRPEFFPTGMSEFLEDTPLEERLM